MTKSGMILGVLLFYFLLLNTISYFLFFWDKRMARRGRNRIPERNLFLTALLGGSLGGLLAMYMFRHKTLHLKFKLGMPFILILQVSLLFFLTLSRP